MTWYRLSFFAISCGMLLCAGLDASSSKKHAPRLSPIQEEWEILSQASVEELTQHRVDQHEQSNSYQQEAQSVEIEMVVHKQDQVLDIKRIHHDEVVRQMQVREWKDLLRKSEKSDVLES